MIRESQLGEIVQLQADERAIAVRITDPSGLSGLLASGMEGVRVINKKKREEKSSALFLSLKNIAKKLRPYKEPLAIAAYPLMRCGQLF